MNNPFNNPILREYFWRDDNCNDLFPEGVMTMGSEPFDEDDFDRFIERRSIDVYAPGGELNVLVIGNADWDEGLLDQQLESLRGEELRVYSQEMFLSYLTSGNDPYDNKEILKIFGEGHAALEYLQEWGFRWPETTIVPSDGTGDFDEHDWPDVGLLKHMGYKVGANAASRWERQRILRDVFTSTLPNVQDIEYMQEWGSPKSKERLLKMANSISSFARNEKRKKRSSSESIGHWEEDLEWLKDEFYHGRFTFTWPSTYVY